MQSINKDGRIHMVPGDDLNIGYFLRFVICGSGTESRHVKFAFDVIREIAVDIANK